MTVLQRQDHFVFLACLCFFFTLQILLPFLLLYVVFFVSIVPSLLVIPLSCSTYLEIISPS